MVKKNKICECCGTKYSYCPSCGADRNKPSWMGSFCSKNCRDLFVAATDYLSEDITKEEAKEIVDKADLTNKASFDKGVVKMINDAASVASKAKSVVADDAEKSEDTDGKEESKSGIFNRNK